MRIYSLCLLAASCSALATAVNANTIFEDQDTALISNPSPAGAVDLGPDGQVGGIGGPLSFTMPIDGLFTLTVQDCCLVGDVYQAFVDGESLGFTSAVPLGGPDLTSGTFSTYLAAGLIRMTSRTRYSRASASTALTVAGLCPPCTAPRVWK